MGMLLLTGDAFVQSNPLMPWATGTAKTWRWYCQRRVWRGACQQATRLWPCS